MESMVGEGRGVHVIVFHNFICLGVTITNAIQRIREVVTRGFSCVHQFPPSCSTLLFWQFETLEMPGVAREPAWIYRG